MTNDEKTTPSREQNIILQNAKRLSLSGVKEVLSFDEQAVSLDTDLGRLEVRGQSLKIDSFNTAIGDMLIFGTVYALVYTGVTQKQSFVKRLFR